MSAAEAGPMDDGALGRSAVAKATVRLIPFLFLLLVLNFLDRVNVGYAALRMNADLGLSPTVFGLGVSIFFIGYLLCEIPSNLILARVGARIWIARIMITWGIVSVGMAFVTGPRSFYVMRFLLGIAEAGLVPGVLYYMAGWFPAQARAANLAKFLVATAVSVIIGAPVSGFVLSIPAFAGLASWQWLFIIEGLPSVIAGCVCLVVLVERPSEAKWLTDPEAAWLERTIKAESEAARAVGGVRMMQALSDSRVWLLSLTYACAGASLFGISFWLPQIVQQMSGLSILAVSLLSALPFIGAAAAMWLNGRHSDATGERTWHVAGSMLIGSLGMAAAALAPTPMLKFIGLCVAAIGVWGEVAVFWTLPLRILTGTAAATGLALINSLGNIGGFAGPYLMGWVRQATGEFTLGLLTLSGLLVLGAVATVAVEWTSGARLEARHAAASARF